MSSAAKPEKPLESDCCGQGCTPCVMDIYEQDLKRWEKSADDEDGDKVSFSPDYYQSCSLKSIERLTSDTCVYRFALPEGLRLQALPGQHLIARAVCASKPDTSFTRQYTILDHWASWFSVMVKIYPNGRMSQIFSKLSPASGRLDWRGPFGEFKLESSSNLVILCMGTGLAPMLSIVSDLLEDDNTDCRVYFHISFKSIDDVLLVSALKKFADYWNVQIELYLSEASSEVSCRYATINRSRIDAKVVKKCTEVSQPDKTRFLVCGSKTFEQDFVQCLIDAGAEKKFVHRF